MRVSKRSQATPRRGKSRAWRAQMRRKAEAEAARRKRARDAGKAERRVFVEGRDAMTRFVERQVLFRARYGRAGGLLLALAWLLHNCIAHPLLGLAPGTLTIWLHDRSADWLNLSPVATHAEVPTIPDRRAWLVHNCVAHPLMGLAPIARAFDVHEITADDMKVEGWV